MTACAVFFTSGPQSRRLTPAKSPTNAASDLKSAASDLDEAVQLDPSNQRAWTSRGLAYERLGQKSKAAGSYAKALNINDKYEPAKAGFARVGGEAGKTYETF